MNNPERINPSEIKIGASEAAADNFKLRSLESSAETTPRHNRDSEAHAARKSAEAVFAKESSREQRQGGEPSASQAQFVR